MPDGHPVVPPVSDFALSGLRVAGRSFLPESRSSHAIVVGARGIVRAARRDEKPSWPATASFWMFASSYLWLNAKCVVRTQGVDPLVGPPHRRNFPALR